MAKGNRTVYKNQDGDWVNKRNDADRAGSKHDTQFIAHEIKKWLASAGIATDYIEPGSPWENSASNECETA